MVLLIINKHIKRKEGFLLIEVLLASALFMLVGGVFIASFLYGQESLVLAGDRSRASYIAEEGLEVVRNIRDADFANLVDGTYGLAISGNQWIFSGSSDTIGKFTRTIQITTAGSDRKDITSTVTWQQNAQRAGVVTMVTRLTNWMKQVATDWTSSSQQSSVNISGNQNGWKVQVQGNYAYVIVSGGSPDFVIIDISNPASPNQVGSLSLSNTPEDIAVSGNYAYIASRHNSQELQVVDISNPNSPSVVATENLPGSNNALGIDIVGSTVYIARQYTLFDDHFYTIDVSNPLNPQVLDSEYLSGGHNNDVKVIGNYAYVVSDDNSEEVRVIDISNPSSISLVSTYNDSGNSNVDSINGYGSMIFIGMNDGIVRVIDISNPLSLSALGGYDAQDNVNDIAIDPSNDYIFLATDENNAEFQVVDVSNPSTPIYHADINLANDLNGIAYDSTQTLVVAVGDDNSEEVIIIQP